MKKISFFISFLGVFFMLSACSAEKKSSHENEEQLLSMSREEMEDSLPSGQTEETTSLFVGKMQEDPTINDSVDASIRLYLTDVDIVEDSDGMLNGIKNNDVILNVPEELLNDETSDKLKKGDKMECRLTSSPIMTMSLPPQIPGNSIISVEKIEE